MNEPESDDNLTPRTGDPELDAVLVRADALLGRLTVSPAHEVMERARALATERSGSGTTVATGVADLEPTASVSDELRIALSRVLPGWLPQQPWFAAKDRSVRSLTVLVGTALITDGDPLLDHVLVEVSFDDESPVHHYQLLVARTESLPAELEQASIGTVDGWTAYDGIWDLRIAGWIADAIREVRTLGGLRFRPEPGVEVPPAPGRVAASPEIDQSNVSVSGGETSSVKMYRRVLSGSNTELEVHRALRRVDSRHVVAVQGTLTGGSPAEPFTFGMLQDRVPNPHNGWAMAVRQAEANGDLTGEARQMGNTLAGVHADLRRTLGACARTANQQAALWHHRLTVALGRVPELVEYASRVREVYDNVAVANVSIPVQRVHGNLHLAQNLLGPDGWLLIDFEGVPGAPVDERVRPDSVVRDVASMLRSFEYAAMLGIVEWGQREESAGDSDVGPERQAHRWADEHGSAFCAGYAERTGDDPRTQLALLRAYELDRAVYEVTFESQVRPSWIGIPLTALARLAVAPL